MNEENADLPLNPHSFFSDHFSLSEKPKMIWEELHKSVPSLPKGWFELSQLSSEDRIEFTKEHWLYKLRFIGRYFEKYEQKIEEFFGNLETIEVYITQIKPLCPYDTHMLYTLKNELGNFQGAPPAFEGTIDSVKRQFGQFPLPKDYWAFMGIHNGFSKYTDTGLIRLQDLTRTYRKFQEQMQEEVLVRPDGEIMDPKNLIPFYESYGLHSYQCFLADWFPDEELGNVYFSTFDHSISNFLNEERMEANLAFPSFIGWLSFYLEDLL